MFLTFVVVFAVAACGFVSISAPPDDDWFFNYARAWACVVVAALIGISVLAAATRRFPTKSVGWRRLWLGNTLFVGSVGIFCYLLWGGQHFDMDALPGPAVALAIVAVIAAVVLGLGGIVAGPALILSATLNRPLSGDLGGQFVCPDCKGQLDIWKTAADGSSRCPACGGQLPKPDWRPGRFLQRRLVPSPVAHESGTGTWECEQCGKLVPATWRRCAWCGAPRRLREDHEYSLVELWERKLIRLHATGRTITHLDARIENLTDTRLRVVIRPGTYFISKGNYQNMVARSVHRLELPARTAGDREYVAVSCVVAVSCINADKPIPGQQDQFFGVARVPDRLARFLEIACNEEAEVVQAGVWAITDGYSKYDVQTRLVSSLGGGIRRPAVSHEQVARAKWLLRNLGIENRL